MSDRIRWESGPYSSFYGKIGALALFSINWGTQKAQPDWTLQTVLPGYAGRTWRSDDRAALERRAGDVLTEFTTSLGAVFPDAGPEHVHPPDWPCSVVCPAHPNTIKGT